MLTVKASGGQRRNPSSFVDEGEDPEGGFRGPVGTEKTLMWDVDTGSISFHPVREGPGI